VWLAVLGVFLVAAAACTPQSAQSTAAAGGWSPVSAGEGVVYVGTRQGRLSALADKGFDGVTLLWSFPAESSGETLPGIYSPPAVGSRFVYVTARDGYLYAVPKDTGQLGERGWRRPLVQPKAALVGAPQLDEKGSVVVIGSEDGNLYGYDADSGAELAWSPFSTSDKIWSSPLVANGVAYFGSHDHNVYAVSLSDGRELWRFTTGGTVVARPLLFKDLIVVGSFDRHLYALEAKTGELRWQFAAKNWFWAGAVGGQGIIFAPSMDGNVYALDASGGLLWQHSMDSPIVSTPVMLPRGLVVASKDGKISLLDPAPVDRGPARELATRTLRNATITAPLSAWGDSVYVGAQDSTVRRIQIKEAQTQVWCFRTQPKDGQTQCE